MDNYPDFTQHGYQVIKELGHNSFGGRVTYQGKRITQNPPLIKGGNIPQTPPLGEVKVVIKQFQFAQQDSNWGEYQAHEQEIKLLQQLNHSGIPCYLDSFQTEHGFCMVQEYKKAQSLANISRNWKPKEIKQIAISVLEILVYLQSEKEENKPEETEEMNNYMVKQHRKTPAIIHRDLKPENILIDAENHVYLVDFGFARTSGKIVAVSSVVKGSMGFMPPEQLFNRQLTKASDLYGLGATLICLLTGTKSTDIGNLVDSNYRFHFRHLIPPQERGWLNWLEKMVEPNYNDRYQSAAEALTALKPLDVNQLPKVRLSQDNIILIASEWGEKLTETLTISNPIPNTILSGRWEVAPHPSDPPHTPYDHSWISFTPQKFESNYVECDLTIYTSQLLPAKTYQRQLILQSNSSESFTIPLEITTASFQTNKIPNYFSLAVIFTIFLGIGVLINLFYPQFWLLGFLCVTCLISFDFLLTRYLLNQIHWLNIVAAFIGSASGIITTVVLSGMYFYLMRFSPNVVILICLTITGAFVGAYSVKFSFFNYNESIRKLIPIGLVLLIAFMQTLVQFFGFNPQLLWLFAGFILVGVILWFIMRFGVVDQIIKGFNQQDAVIIVFLTAGFGIVIGALLPIIARFQGFSFSLDLCLLGIFSFASLSTITYLLYQKVIIQPHKVKRLITQYQQNQQQLIKP